MNDQWDDTQLRQKLQRSHPDVPAMISSRVDETLESLRRKPKFLRKLFYSAAAVCVSLVCLTGAGVIYPNMAQALRDVPVLGSAFEVIGDVGIRISSEMGITSKVSETAEDKGITMTITEVLYDGIRLSIGYVIETGQDIRPSGDVLYVNGRKLGYSAAGNGRSASDRLYAGIVDYEPKGQLPEQFNLKIQYESMVDWSGGEPKEIKGLWKFNIPVTKLKEGIVVKTFDIAPTVQFQNKTINVKKVTLTPAITSIELDVIEPMLPGTEDPEEKLLQFQTDGFQVFDDKGIMLQGLGESGHSTTKDGDELRKTEQRIRLAPMRTIPEYLIIRPISKTHSTDPNKKYTYTEDLLDEMKLPITLSQGKAGQVTITKVEFLVDRTLLHFRVEGEDPYAQAENIWIEDQEGNKYIKSISDLKTVEGLPYSFIQKFPPVDRSLPLKVKTIELDPPKVAQELELKIPLKEPNEK